jgi:4-aminobutyrate aminotransferase-like enzyme
LLANAGAMHDVLHDGFTELASRHELIGNVQGSGLFWGLDLVADRTARGPIAYADAKRIATGLRHRGILAGVTGRYTNVLKIRPPLPFRGEHAELLLTELDALLGSYELRGGSDARALGAEW